MIFLRQSTAVDVSIGPFLDDTDGKTAETALTITQPDIRLKKNGGAWAQKNAAQTLTHEEAGWYEIALDATDTNTLGCLLVAVHEAGALPCWREFEVIPADVFDALVNGTGIGMRSDVRAWLGTAAATPTVAGVPEVDVTHFNGAAGTFAAGRPEVNTSHVAGTAQTARDLGLQLDAAVSTRATPAQVNTEVDAALDTAIPGVPTAGSINERIKTMDDADIPAAVAAVQADTNDLQTRTPAALVGGRTDAIASVIGADAVDAAALKADAVTEIVAGLLAGVIEGAVTLKQSLQLSNAAAAGKLSGAGTTAIALRNLADTLDRIAATVDASGNRSAVVRTYE
jgi:hypothetical protein